MPRQSKRLSSKEHFYGSPDSSDNENTELLAKATVQKKPSGKKRKNDPGDFDEQPKKKKARKKNGILKQLMDMPVDILLEVFSWFTPLEVLNLSLTSKDLRAFVLDSTVSTRIWTMARSNVSGLPDLPTDMTESQYAHLAFGKNCYSCNKNPAPRVVLTCWAGRLRTCTTCVKTNKFFKDYYYVGPDDFPELKSFIPTLVVECGRSYAKTFYYYILHRRWIEESRIAEDSAKWLQAKIQERKIINEHAVACRVWFENLRTIRREENKATIIQHLKDLGWESELAQMSPNRCKPQDDVVVRKAIDGHLTEHALSKLDAFFNKFMRDVRRDRLTQERRVLLKDRLPTLKQLLEELLDDHISTLPATMLYPTIGDLFRNSAVYSVITEEKLPGPCTKGYLRALIPPMSSLILEWQQDLEDKLCDLMTRGKPRHSFDRKKVFQLATTVFGCKRCSHAFISYPRVLMHACGTNPDYVQETLEPDEQVVREHFRQRFWNSAGDITFSQESLEMIKGLLRLCHLDPDSTTAEAMDAANPIFECIPCNDIYGGRLTLAWTAVLDHHRAEHGSQAENTSKMELKLLDKEEADIVRARMLESQERQNSERLSKRMICTLCNKNGNTPDLVNHVVQSHGIAEHPTDHVLPLVDSDQIPAPFRLWPPRSVTSNAVGTRS
ncbi:hypothetical protein GALMADRAFT_261532 [Galerina marginata CBS 339.88]|uniref:F-box domain-containing protein n=1 Tax=Galerina marginata (strain CBS 339.88) TaxID=685588 RepID=A0A067TU64_GALM3|nr:hypothetical protein GALMADRAFT_261532 [Galerina marginata CBS 339.88]